MSQYFRLDKFVYNDTFVRSHVPPVPLPLPHEFTVVYAEGWGEAVPKGCTGTGAGKEVNETKLPARGPNLEARGFEVRDRPTAFSWRCLCAPLYVLQTLPL